MASQRYDYCLLEIKPSLEEIRLGEGEWMQVQLVEVWGCGGREAQETQQRIKEWEARQVLRRREVIQSPSWSMLPSVYTLFFQVNSKTPRTTWEDNPDRLLLEMGGVTTSTPTENL